MKKILYITYRNFYPIFSGEKITMMQNLILLSKHYEVDCLIIDDKKMNDSELEYLRKYAKNVFFFQRSNLLFKLFNCLKFLLKGRPLQNGYFYSKKADDFVSKNYHDYDLLFCTHMRTGQYVINIEEIKKVLVCPDCITLNSKNEAKSSKLLRKAIFKLEAKNVEKFESHEYEKFDFLYIISENDKQKLSEIAPRIINKTGLLFNYARDLGFSNLNLESPKPEICFLGKLSYGPNVAAILYFSKNIFPKLKEYYPDLVFNVYGSGSSRKLKSLFKLKGVKIHGYIEDIAKEIQKNCFVVAPMISGSGTQNKILECMFLKKLIVTTQIGVDGLYNLSGNEIIVGNNDKDLIEKCLYFLSDDHQKEKKFIEDNARKYIIKNYSEAISEKQLNEPLEKIF